MWNSFELIGETVVVNEYGDPIKTPTYRRVLGDEASVGMKEFYQGMAVGFQPEVKITLTNWLDYQGEHQIRFAPFGYDRVITFDIIRTYRNGEALELTCQRGVEP